MSTRSAKVCAVLVVVVLTAAFSAYVLLAAEPIGATSASAIMWLNPAAPAAEVGETADVVVQLDSISNVFGASFEVQFDPAILSVVDADAGRVGIQITPGTCPAPDFVVENTVTVTGEVRYGATQLAPTPPCDGGAVATIEFMCEAEGISTLVLTNTLVADNSGLAIAHSVAGGSMSCSVPPAGYMVTGTVALQGWLDPSGIKVTLWDSLGAIADGPVAVGSDGAFSLNAPLDLEDYYVDAEHDRYLTVQSGTFSSTVGVHVDLGLATLPAGDLNGDGLINIQDVNLVAGNFGKSSPVSWEP